MTERINKRSDVISESDRMPEYDIFQKLDKFKENREKLKWEGNLSEYIQLVRENPEVVRLAYQTVSDTVCKPELFSQGRFAMYGAEKAIEEYRNFMRGGAAGLPSKNRIVLLVGPPGSGKSTLANGTKYGLEQHSATDEGASYMIADCPMQDEPFNLLPLEVRQMLKEEAKAKGVHLDIDGGLCPHCEKHYGRLLDPNVDNASDDPDAITDIRDVPVKRFLLSESKRIGIDTFKPADPKSQDMGELVGSVNINGLAKHGRASDADAYSFDGAFMAANRGVIEMVEMFKNDARFLYALLDVAQDRMVKAPRFGNIPVDLVVVAHTNMTELRRYTSDSANEALNDRITVIEVPYTLETSSERKIYEKLIGESRQIVEGSIHINPHSLNSAALFAVLSRLKGSAKYDKLKKARVYDSQKVDGLSHRDMVEMRAEHPHEGMSGISPRFVSDSLSTALVKSGAKGGCLTPADTIRALIENMDSHPHTRNMKPEERAELLKDIDVVKKEFAREAQEEVTGAFIDAYGDHVEQLFEKYLDNVEASVMKHTIVDQVTGEERAVNEVFMRGIEQTIKVTDTGKNEFRQQVHNEAGAILRRGEALTPQSMPRVYEAIKLKLFDGLKDVIKLSASTTLRNKEQNKRIEGAKRELIEKHGHCAHSADEMIRFVGDSLSR